MPPDWSINWPALITPALVAINIIAIAAVALRVISKRRTQGVSLAWLTVLAWLPGLGIVLYILVGEAWLTRRRARRIRALESAARKRFESLEPFAAPEDPSAAPHLAPLNRIARATADIPTLAGNAIDLLDDADAFFPALLDAINHAERTIDLLFYIYHPGARADQVTDALVAAADRGVQVRLLLDAVGSKRFLKHKPTRRRLKQHNIEVRTALPVRFPRRLFARVDLRNHRKLAVIDTRLAFVGSSNLADPAVFKRRAKVGPWVDVMSRVRGPAVNALDLLFAIDWAIECNKPNKAPLESALAPHTDVPPDTAGNIPVQLLSTGPGDDPDELRRVLVQSIYQAREELVISTPYFVPDDTMLTALVTAALRGVAVTLIVPAKVDSFLVRHAARSYYSDLVRAGIQIRKFTPGLLHAKTVVIDRQLTLIGSANMDRRSLWINFELSLFAHDKPTAEAMRAIQDRYIEHSKKVEPKAWLKRDLPSRLLDNAAQLLSPIL